MESYTGAPELAAIYNSDPGRAATWKRNTSITGSGGHIRVRMILQSSGREGRGIVCMDRWLVAWFLLGWIHGQSDRQKTDGQMAGGLVGWVDR